MANEHDSQIVEALMQLPIAEQLPYLLRVKDDIIDDSCYWQVVAAVWIGSDICSPYLSIWREIFAGSFRRNRHKLMKGNDRKVWRSLPKMVKAYRAINHQDEYITGISWTLSKAVAQRLANGRKIVSNEWPKKCVVAYFDRRGEQEIICLYEEVV
jgi:hypothetical protein